MYPSKLLSFLLTFNSKKDIFYSINGGKLMAITFNAQNFQTEVLSSDKPVLVDFWAPWCGPCKMLTPTIDKLATDFEGQAKVGKVNVDENQDLAAKYSVTSIPTVLVVYRGEVVEQFIGVQPLNVYVDAINKYL